MERIVKGIWVPIEIWEDDDLCLNEKALLMDIDSFTSRGRECYISNEWICEHLGVAKRTAQMYLKHLIDRNLVRVVKFDGRVRYLESNLPTLAGRGAENCTADVQKFAPQTCKDLHHTNTKSDLNKRTDNKTPLPPFDFYKALINAGVTPETAEAWLVVRKAKRSVNSELAFRETMKEVRKSGRSAEECIRFSAARSWAGFMAQWLEREENGMGTARARKPKDGDAMMRMYEKLTRSSQPDPNDLPDLPDEQ